MCNGKAGDGHVRAELPGALRRHVALAELSADSHGFLVHEQVLWCTGYAFWAEHYCRYHDLHGLQSGGFDHDQSRLD